ncbi:MAG: PAS domain S-box protein, partial [Deltaproteobacteria bacterium]|nr:PAS domain S-box protein [Deltaproteobacteria bacterium]
MIKAKVLIVEDDGIIAMDIQSRLMSLGFDVSGMVSSGEEAIYRAKETPPDIVLMDIRLEGEMDGIEAADQIRTQFNIPVVYLTAYAEEAVLERAKITEPFGYILKPIENRELHRVIEIALVKHKTEAALRKAHNELENIVAERTSELVVTNEQLRREIKGRKRVEQVLRESEEQYRTLMDNLPVAVYRNTPGPKGEILMANPAFCKMFGFKNKEEVKDFTPGSLYQNPKERKEYSDNLIQKGVIRNDERTLLKRDGTPVYTSITSCVVHGKDGEVSYFDTMMLDISEQKRIEKALQESEILMHSIFNSLEEAIFVVCPDRTVVNMNESARKIFGYSKEELLRLSTEVLHVDHAHYVEFGKRTKAIFDGAKASEFEFELKNKNGDILSTEHTVSVLKNDAGKPLGIISVVRDITDRKVAKEALKRSDANLAEAQRIAHLGSWDYDVVNDKLLLSEEIYRIVGLTPQEFGISYEAFMNLVYPDDRELVEKSVDRALNEGTPYNIEHRIILPTGEERIVHEMAEVLFDETGSPIRMLGTLQDISERIRSERKVLQSEERLQAVFDGISDPLIMVDKDMKVLLQNRAAMKYYGIPYTTNCLNKECHQVFNGNPDLCEGCNIRSAVSNGRHESFERKGFMDPERLEQIVIYPLDHEDHGEGAAIIRISDVTRERKMERELIEADKMISLGVLVSGVAHEINNPNNFIMLNAPLLREAWESIVPVLERYYDENGDFSLGGLPYSEMRDEIPQLFSGIKEGSDRIQRIVQDLKGYARQDGTDMDQSVNINEVIKRSTRLTGSLIKKATKNFRVEYGRNLPLIRGNEQKLEQVMINLIQNACQALPDKEKGIFVTSSFDKEGGGVRVEVRDEGDGIPENLLPRIMDPFFTTRRGEGGTGLGMSVSSNIVKGHGGKIEVESERGKGTAFRFFIPTTRIEEPAKILVADDDRDIRELLHTALGEIERYIVREASTGAEAFLKIGREPPDLLILDVQMPDMDGVEVCRLIKEKP